MNILNNVKNFFRKVGNAIFGKKKSTSKLVKMEDGTLQPEKMSTGGSNGILTAQERNHANRELKKKKKARKKNKQQRTSRNINHKIK